jgi:DNA polymerase III gamma/tau subunit
MWVQAGLIPDEKLVDLLDVALGADTANTVKGMRALLEAGVDALSLVAQLGSLITNILAGAFDVPREARKKGFFHRNMRKLLESTKP